MTKQVIQPRDYTGMASSIKGTMVDLEVELEGESDKTKIYHLQHRIYTLGTLLKSISNRIND